LSGPYILVRFLSFWCAGLILVIGLCLPSQVAAESNRRAQVEAGLIYKFTSFIDWPAAAFFDKPKAETAEKVTDDQFLKKEFIIGVMANDSMLEAFDPVVGTNVKGHKLVVKKLTVSASAEDLRRCHIIYFGESLEAEIGNILSRVEGSPVVTVSSMEKFIEHGGIISFREEQSRIRFAINMRAARMNEVGFRAKLLRVASQVVGAKK